MLRIVGSLARIWVRMYTLGLPRAVRDERRDEIDSDLSEHFSLALAEGQSTARTTWEVFLRVVRGIPSDALWRLEVPRTRTLAVARAGSGGSASLFYHRRQNSWFDRNGWIVPVAMLLLLIAAMWWMMDSTRPSRFGFDLETPAYITASDPHWDIAAHCCGRRGTPTWDELRNVHTLELTNGTSHTLRARIAGLAELPDQVEYAYGVIPSGSVQAHAALEHLLDAYGDRMTGAPNPQAVTEAFVAEELPRFNVTFARFFGTEIKSMQEAWSLRDTWLRTLPESRVCSPNTSDATTCSGALSIPPNSTIEIAVVVTIPTVNESAEGRIEHIALRLVDETAQ